LVAPQVSVLFNEPKLLKSNQRCASSSDNDGFSALQRAEIAEMSRSKSEPRWKRSFSALQRAEIAEIALRAAKRDAYCRFSALQRAEIAEIMLAPASVSTRSVRFSALQRAEIAEMPAPAIPRSSQSVFQCSSTSRNC